MIWLIIALLIGFFSKHIIQNLVCKNACSLVEGSIGRWGARHPLSWRTGVEGDENVYSSANEACNASRWARRWENVAWSGSTISRGGRNQTKWKSGWCGNDVCDQTLYNHASEACDVSLVGIEAVPRNYKLRLEPKNRQY